MKSLVEKFQNQLRDALRIGGAVELKASNKNFTSVFITGLGGSGIGGTIVSQLVRNEIKIPVVINNDYNIPAFVGENTLVIASSFSGNTEETLMALEQCINRGAEIACITSGGELGKIAQKNGYNHIILPTEKSPRAMLTYSLTQQFFLLHHYGLISDSFKKEIETSANLIDENLTSIQEGSKDLAEKLFNKTAVIYSEARYEGVAIRFRQQLNENSKVLCWHHALPEMNHNELVGWAGGDTNKAVVVFRSEDDHPRTQRRMDLSREIIEGHTNTFIEVNSKGTTEIQRSLYLIAFGDWVSVFLAELNEVDPIEVYVITKLKNALAES